MDEIKELKEEIIRLRERVAVLEARTANTQLTGQRIGSPQYSPVIPMMEPPFRVTCK